MEKKIEEIKVKLLNEDLQDFLQSIEDYDINEFDKFGNNILHYYVKNRDAIHIEAASLLPELINRGLDINAKQLNKDKRSALYLATLLKSKEVFTTLIDLGAEIDSTDDNGNTPLWQAVFNYRDDDGYFIQLLLQKGAKPTIKNNHGVSPEILANRIANYNSKMFFAKPGNNG